MFEYLTWLDAEKTTIQAKRADGSTRIIDAATADLFGIAKAGKLGAIAAYAPPRVVTKAELLAVERAGMKCSRFQAKAALHAAGLLDDVETAMATADRFAQIAWADAIEFRRNSPTIKAIADAMKLKDAQIDTLFRAAMQIEA